MSVAIGARKRIQHMRRRVLGLLPDVCSLHPMVYISNEYGAYTNAPGDAILYNGSDVIPCRVDPTAHYRQTNIYQQEAVVDEYTLWLPIGVPIEADWVVRFNGHDFQIRKIMEYHTDAVLTEALIAIVE